MVLAVMVARVVKAAPVVREVRQPVCGQKREKVEQAELVELAELQGQRVHLTFFATKVAVIFVR